MSYAPLPRPRALLRKVVMATLSLSLGAAGLVTSTPAQASAAPVTLWGVKAPAHVKIQKTKAARELGNVFTPKVAGSITAIRFYKAAGAKGKHTGALWTSAGHKMAAVKFTHETASGWQTAKLAKPVKVTAGRTYVVSYHVPKSGRYGATANFKGSSISSALVVKRSLGVFSTKSSVTFPRTKSKSSQFWVDVLFSAAVSSGTSTTPTTPNPPVSAAETSGSYPTRTSVGLPAGWKPVKEVTGDVTISTPGQVVEDLRVTNGTIYVNASNVTLRRVQGVGAFVQTDMSKSCSNGLVVENSEFVKNGSTADSDPPVIGQGGFTFRNSVIDGRPEGIRAGAGDIGCGPVVVENSYIRVVSPDKCTDWHGDGLQGYGGGKVTVRKSTFIMSVVNDCWGTAPFFYPSNQGNTSVDIDGMLVSGGGYPFRNGMPGTVKNLNVVDGSWVYGPVDVNCSALSAWQAQVVKVDAAGATTPVRSIACTGQGN